MMVMVAVVIGRGRSRVLAKRKFVKEPVAGFEMCNAMDQKRVRFYQTIE